MPKIDFCFSGWVRGAKVTTAMDIKKGCEIDVSKWTSKQLITAIENGEIAIGFSAAYDSANDSACDMDAYEVST